MIINLDKMRCDGNIKVRLKDEYFEMFLQNVGEYFSKLENAFSKTPPRINPMEALNIISMLSGFKDYFDSEHEWERLTLESLGVLRKGISGGFFGKFSAFSGMAHVAFVAHNLSLKAPNIRPFVDGINKILVDNLSKYLHTTSEEDLMNRGSYEVISGLSGPLRYLIDFPENNEMIELAEKIVDSLIRRSEGKVIAGHNVTGWHYYPTKAEASFIPFDTPNGVVNYGISHGMASPLAILPMAYKNGIRRKGLEDAINGLISEYMETYYYVNDIIYWPGMITLEQRVGLKEINKEAVQMSWCYSSIGNLRALYLAGDSMDNDRIKQFVTSEYTKVAMMDIPNFLLKQPIVCHGHAGTAAVIHSMYLDTKIPELLQKALEMAEISTQFNIGHFFEHQNQIHKSNNTPLRTYLHEYLEGYTGILQSILSIMKGEPNENEKRLLIF